MKKIFCLAAAAVILLGCESSVTSSNDTHRDQEQLNVDTVIDTKANLHYVFTISDAEKILGEPAHLTDSASTITAHYSCAYKANDKDQESGKTGSVYFLSERYPHISSAKDKYSSIKTANENHEGVKELHDIGDEAYFHSDGQNFYFIIVRKGRNVFNMKVNKITSKTSLDEFNLIAKKIASAL